MIHRYFLLVAELFVYLILLPFFIWSHFPLREYSTFTAPSQLLSFFPGNFGILLRRVWYRTTLKSCGSNLTVDWLGVIRVRESEIGSRCTIGVGSWVGWVRMGSNVITGSNVTFVSGARQHKFDDTIVPIRDQQGEKKQLIIGNDVWVGTHAIIMADVSAGTVVGAGSVVTKKFSSQSVIVGNPARLLKSR